MNQSKSYALMELAPGRTLNELAYKNPDVLEENRIRIAFQLGMHTAFSYVFGLKDGYQTNYLFDHELKTITRVDNERFFCLPDDPEKTLNAGHSYAQDIAACEMENLKYIPSSRKPEEAGFVLKAFNAGFIEKYREIKNRKERLLQMVETTREDAFKVTPYVPEPAYAAETKRIVKAVSLLIGQNPEDVLKRLYAAKTENSRKK